MEGLFADLLRSKGIDPEQNPKPKQGFVWLTMLIKFDTDGNAEIVRTFSKPAKDSDIKGMTKPKKAKPDIKLEKTEKEDLFL